MAMPAADNKTGLLRRSLLQEGGGERAKHCWAIYIRSIRSAHIRPVQCGPGYTGLGLFQMDGQAISFAQDSTKG